MDLIVCFTAKLVYGVRWCIRSVNTPVGKVVYGCTVLYIGRYTHTPKLPLNTLAPTTPRQNERGGDQHGSSFVIWCHVATSGRSQRQQHAHRVLAASKSNKQPW
jgi:hypothetical protein